MGKQPKGVTVELAILYVLLPLALNIIGVQVVDFRESVLWSYLVADAIGIIVVAIGQLWNKPGLALLVLATSLSVPFVQSMLPPNSGAPAIIEAPIKLTVLTGQAVDIPIVIKDKRGVPFPAGTETVTVQPESLGSYQNRRFLAGARPESGYLLIRAGAVESRVTVEVIASERDTPAGGRSADDQASGGPQVGEGPWKIQVQEQLALYAGQTAEIPYTVTDRNGVAIQGVSAIGMVMPSTLGTFSNGQFTAGSHSGTGTLLLKAREAEAVVYLSVLNPQTTTPVRIEGPSSFGQPLNTTLPLRPFFRVWDVQGNEIKEAILEVTASPPSLGTYHPNGDFITGDEVVDGFITVTSGNAVQEVPFTLYDAPIVTWPIENAVISRTRSGGFVEITWQPARGPVIGYEVLIRDWTVDGGLLQVNVGKNLSYRWDISGATPGHNFGILVAAIYGPNWSGPTQFEVTITE